MWNALRVRELYCPSHFGNYYEVAMDNEMEALLAEAEYWGFNRYSDWFDTIDLRNLYESTHGLYNLPEAVWDRKFAHFISASRMGFDLGLVITPNHVFMDQVTRENEAEKTRHIFGQLVCPSKPGVVDMILENYRNLFRDFEARGLNLTAISAGAYDYGGCNCENCRPWMVTFGTLVKQIVTLARDFFEDVEAELWGWWWTDSDHEAFTKWADAEESGFFTALAHHILYGESEYKVRPVPASCRERAFINIGYGEKSGSDVYGHYGPTIAPVRLEKTFRFLVARQADGFLAYSEGMCDEINKAILAGLGSGQYRNADEVLEAYAERHLGGDTKGWAAWLRNMGDVEAVDSERARSRFDRLAAASEKTWRLQALEEKLRMCEAESAVRAGEAWDEARLQAGKAFWDAKERLWRGIWRRGLGRHVFKFDWKAPEWHKEYSEIIAKRQHGVGRTRLDEA